MPSTTRHHPVPNMDRFEPDEMQPEMLADEEDVGEEELLDDELADEDEEDEEDEDEEGIIGKCCFVLNSFFPPVPCITITIASAVPR